MKNTLQIAPSLLACDLGRMAEEIKAVEKAGADVVHFDVMDGQFVPNITFGFPVIESVRKVTDLPFDVHLMIKNADSVLEECSRVGCNWVSVHVEACPHIHRTLHRIRELGMLAGVAINPGTSLFALEGIIHEIDYVLVMSVNPGFGGQRFIPTSLNRIREIKKNLSGTNVKIEVDGGIKHENLAAVVEAGADILVMGTGLFGQKDYKRAIEEFRVLGARNGSSAKRK